MTGIIKSDNIKNLDLFSSSEPARPLTLCDTHKTELIGSIAYDINAIVHTEFFQKNFKEFLPTEGTSGTNLYVRVSKGEILVRKLDVDNSQPPQEKRVLVDDETKQLNLQIIKKADDIYNKCLSHSGFSSHPNSTPPTNTLTNTTINPIALNNSTPPANNPTTTANIPIALNNSTPPANNPTTTANIPIALNNSTPPANTPTTAANLTHASQSSDPSRNNEIANLSRQTILLTNDQLDEIKSLANEFIKDPDSTVIPPGLLDKFKALPIETQNFVFFQTYILRLNTEPAPWKYGEHCFLNETGNTATNLERAFALFNVAFLAFADELTYLKDTPSEQMLQNRLKDIPDGVQKRLFIQLGHQKQKPQIDTDDKALKAFFDKEGFNATNSDRINALNRLVEENILLYYRFIMQQHKV